jgi:putative DNA primase/helicase
MVSETILNAPPELPVKNILPALPAQYVRAEQLLEILFTPEARPSLRWLRQTAARFNPNAGAELFLSKLAEMLPDEMDRDLLQLCFGNFLLPDCRHEVALVCYGEAGCGKSTIAEPVAAALGGELVKGLTLNQLCDKKGYNLPDLQFAAVNLAAELDVIAVDESANFKTLVSGEAGEVQKKYKNPFTMKTACKLWFLANGLPRFKHGSAAEQRRTRFIGFNHSPKERDVTLKNRLLAERDGVFNFMLAGLQKLLTLTEIPLGGAESRAVHERFKISNDPLGSFVNLHCQFDPAARETKTALRSAFDDFCETNGFSSEFGEMFHKRLLDRFPNLKEIRVGSDGERVRCIEGIRLKTFLEVE